MNTNREKAYDEKKQECDAFINQASELPKEFTISEWSLWEGMRHLTEKFDGDRGVNDAIILKINDSSDMKLAIRKLIEWKRAIMTLDTSYSWEEDGRTYSHRVTVDEIDKYKKAFLIQTEFKPKLKRDELELLEKEKITFIYQLDCRSYYDWIDGNLYVYDYETYAGSADDAATYAYWSRKITSSGKSALNIVHDAMRHCHGDGS